MPLPPEKKMKPNFTRCFKISCKEINDIEFPDLNNLDKFIYEIIFEWNQLPNVAEIRTVLTFPVISHNQNDDSMTILIRFS